MRIFSFLVRCRSLTHLTECQLILRIAWPRLVVHAAAGVGAIPCAKLRADATRSEQRTNFKTSYRPMLRESTLSQAAQTPSTKRKREKKSRIRDRKNNVSLTCTDTGFSLKMATECGDSWPCNEHGARARVLRSQQQDTAHQFVFKLDCKCTASRHIGQLK